MNEAQLERKVRKIDNMLQRLKSTKVIKPVMPLNRVCPNVTGELLMIIAYHMLMADILSPPGSHHNGNPDTLDINGESKRGIYHAINIGDVAFFQELAEAWNKGKWHKLTISRRTIQWKKRKARPIDLSSEARRLYSAWILWHLDRLVREKDWLPSTVVGFRSLKDFPEYRKRKDGITIQDVYLSIVWGLVLKYGPWLVLLDQKDAYGNLPHKAIHAALKALGTNQRDRRIIVEMVRVRTVGKNGRIIKHRAYGIEQGSILSPLIFNIVQGYLVREIQAKGFHMASYGDDISTPAPTQDEAHQAFEVYKEVTDALGYKNTRPLGTTGKATRIIDTRIEQADLIKTFRFGRGEIALTEDKVNELLQRLGENPSLRNIRKTNQWKIISKSFLKSLNRGITPGSDSKPSVRPPTNQGEPEVDSPTAPAAKGDVLRALPLDRWEPEPQSRIKKGGSDPHRGEVDGGIIGSLTNCTQYNQEILTVDDSYYRGVGSMVRMLEDLGVSRQGEGDSPTRNLLIHFLENTMSTSRKAGIDLAGDALGGRMSVLRGGSGARVTPGLKDGEGLEHRPSPSDTVLSIRDEDIEALNEGRRLRVGDYYRDNLIDCRWLSSQIQGSRISHALSQLCRVGSLHGRVQILIHPGEDWAYQDDLFCAVQVLESQERADGIILRILREKSAHPQRHRLQQIEKAPPNMDLTIRTVRRHRDDTRNWTVVTVNGCKKKVFKARVTSSNLNIGKVEAIAEAICRRNPHTIALPATGMLRQLLMDSVRIRQVGLADAISLMRGWEWKVKGKWLMGVHKNR